MCSLLKIFVLAAVIHITLAQTETTVNQTNLMTNDSAALIPECNIVEANKPNFEAPGRRISEAKCYEYIWELKNRFDQNEKVAKCREIIRNLTRVRFVVGGRKTIVGEFPHMGAIGWKTLIDTWIFKCGSSLISPKFVLTAAHCTKASPRDTSIADIDPKIVRFGTKNIFLDNEVSSLKADISISRVIIHPMYKPPKKYYDIALMELETEVQFNKMVQPACLWHKPDDSFGNLASVTGWGILKAGARNTSAELQAGDVNIINSTSCGELLKSSSNRHWDGIKDHQLCAGKPQGGVDACQGDSGGPLQVQIPLPKTFTAREGSMYNIIGVTSFGVGCALPNLPGVYTRVSSFIDWIENIVWISQ